MTGILRIARSVQALLVLMILISPLAQAQLPEIEINSADLITVPNSPEASAFIEYGNNTVSMYTGIPDISIPLHTVQGRKLSLPISLSYSPGVKVDQIASNVGLGWNLNAGGSVVRNVVGLVDNYQIGHHSVYYSDEFLINGKKLNDQFEYFNQNNIMDNARYSPSLVHEYLDFRRKALDGQLDTQPDSYSFNINGLSGTLYIDYETETGFCLEHPDLKVEVRMGPPHSNGVKELYGWTLTDKMGTVYRFMESETTHTFDDSSVSLSNVVYNSAWKISQICTFNNKDCIDFNYGDLTKYKTLQPVQGAVMRRDGPNDDGSSNQCSDGFTQYSGSPYFTISKSYLQSIDVNFRTEVWINYANEERADLRGTYAVTSISIMNAEGDEVNKIKLDTDYFGNPGSIYEFDSRLMLKGIEVYKRSSDDPDRYDFGYFGPQLPSRGDFAQDYWGYFNGASNLSLIPYNANYTIFTEGANRNVSPAHVRAGTLKSIQYPTGGTTKYSYEIPFRNLPPQEVEVLLGSWGVIGGTDATNAIGYCDDVAGDPKGITGELVIPRTGSPEDLIDLVVKLQVLGTNEANPIQFVAFYGNNRLDTHCDIYENQTLLFSRDGDLSDETFKVQVLPGAYRYMILNDQPGVEVKLSVSKIELEDSGSREYVGGLRINKIEDKDYSGEILGQRYFYYGDLSKIAPEDITASYLGTGQVSSGILHRPAIYETSYNAEQFKEGIYFDCEFLNRFSSNQATATPHVITYSTVTEVPYDPENSIYNGFTVHQFYNDSEGSGIDPYKKRHLLNGKLVDKKVYGYDPVSNTNKIILKEEKTYETNYLATQSRGLFFKGNRDAEFIDMSIWEDEVDNSLHYYRYTRTPVTGLKGEGVYPTKCATIDDEEHFVKCILSTGGSLGDPSTSPSEIYTQQNTGVSAYWIKDGSSTTTTFDEENESLTLVNRYISHYSTDMSHYQLVGMSTTDNKGNNILVKNFYPQDLGDQAAAMGSLIEQNRIGEVVKTERFYNESSTPQIQKIKIYETFDGIDNYLPSEIKLNHGSGHVQSIKVVDYDNHNNIKELVDKDGITHTYLWSYRGENMVAHVTGATYNQVVEVLGNPIEYDEDNGEALSLGQHIQLRDGLKDALVTSYVYEDGVGQTAMRDPNGKETLYSYDDHNRLEYVTEFGDQLAAYEYNTRTEEGRVIKLGGLIQFGTIEINQPISKTLTITNIGSMPLSIEGLSHSNEHFSGNWSGIIQPGKSQNIEISLISSNGGNFKNFITVASDKTKGDHQVLCTATVIFRKIALAGSLDWGNQLLGSSESKNLTIFNIGNDDLVIDGISYSNDQFSGTWSGVITPADSQIVAITYAVTSIGTQSGTLTVNSNKTSGSNTKLTTSFGVSRVMRLGGKKSWGDVDLNSTITHPLTIFNDGNTTLTIDSIFHSNDDYSGAWSGTIESGTYKIVDVKLTPSSEGASTDTITVHSNKTSGPNTRILTSYGATRVIRLGGKKSWGDVDLNSTLTHALEIFNDGNTTLTIDSIFHSNDDYSGAWSGTIEPGAYEIVDIKLTPSSEGANNDTITVYSNKTSGPDTRILTSYGVSRVMRLGGKKSWGDVDLNSTITHPLTIFNDGNTTLTIDSIFHSNNDYSGAWSGTIESGAYKIVNVKLTPSSGGVSNDTITVYSNKTSGPDTRILTSFVITRTIKLSGASDITSIDADAEKTLKLIIENTGNRPLSIADITHSNSDFSGNWNGTLEPNASTLVSILFQPSASGVRENTITVNSDKTNGTSTKIVTANVISRIISMSASTLSFGEIDIKKSGSKTLNIKNIGNAALTIDSITHSHAQYSGSWSGTIEAGASKDITVMFKPTTGGTKSNTITVHSNRTSGGHTRLTTGFGVTRKTSLGGTTAWGDVDINKTRSKTLKISNIGNRTLTVNSISHSNSHYSGDWSGTIEPGTYKNVTIKFTPESAGASSNKITVNSNRTNGTHTRTVNSFVVTRTIKLSGASDIESIDADAEETLKLLIENTGNRPLSITGITHSNSDFSGNWVGTLEPNASTLVSILFQPSASGARENTITVNSDKTNGTSTKIVTATVVSRVISMSGNTLSFGAVDINKTTSKTLNIKNIGNTTLTINSLSHSNSQYTGSWSGTIAAGASKNITINFKPTSGGTKSNTITVSSNRTGGGFTRLATGFGRTRTIVLSGTTAFGDTDINSSRSKSLTIKNTGNRTLTINSISHSSGKFSGTWSGTIAAGASQTVSIKFKPTSAGTKNNTITVNSNRTGGTNTRSVNGRGIARTISLSGNLAFGNLTIRTSKTLKLSITNTGNRTLTVSSISHSNSYYSGNWSGTLAPGANVLVGITFKPTGGGTRNNTITVNSDKTNGTNTRSATGYSVTRVISMSSSTLAFGDIDINKSVTKTLNIKNTGNGALTVSKISHSNSNYSGSWSGSIAPGASRNVTITFKPTSGGTRSNTMTVYTDRTSGTPTRLASGYGVTRTVSLSGTTSWGDVAINTSRTKTLTIKNTGNRTLSVSSISHSNSNFSGNWSGTLDAGASRNVTLTFKPTVAGTRSGTITVNSNRTNGTHTKSETGFGLTRIVSLSGSLSFGSRTINTSTTKTFTIKNTGNRTLTVSSVTAPSQYSVNWTGGTIAAGATKTVTVTFRPTSSGSKGGNIAVHGNKTSGGKYVAVSGTGLSRIIRLSGNMSFGDVNVDNSKASSHKDQNLRVYNDGNSTLTISSISVPSNYSCVSCTFSQSVSAGSYKDFKIRFDPSSAGTKNGTITVYSNRTNGTPTKSVTGYGATRILVLSPNTSLNFGSVNYTSGSVTKNIQIRNDGNRTMTVSSLSLPVHYSANWSGGSISANGNKWVVITYNPSSIGTHNGTITINTNQTSNNDKTVTVTGSGTSGSTGGGGGKGTPEN